MESPIRKLQPVSIWNHFSDLNAVPPPFSFTGCRLCRRAPQESWKSIEIRKTMEIIKTTTKLFWGLGGV